jgi:hypothetical protein
MLRNTESKEGKRERGRKAGMIDGGHKQEKMESKRYGNTHKEKMEGNSKNKLKRTFVGYYTALQISRIYGV